MSLDLYRVGAGLDIIADDLSSNANMLQGIGLPGGDAGFQDAAPIGSAYMRTDVEANNLQFYFKWSTANNSSADWKTVADKGYVDAVAAGLSWREPVRVLDTTVYANAAAFPIGGVIDGVTLNDGDRVLFSGSTLATDRNVFIWSAGGSTWTEDANAESDGDALLIQEGTSADQQYTFDGTNWVLFGSASSTAEIGFLRTYVGKTGPGSETPTYASTNAIAQSSNLETAIGVLDGMLGTGEITNDGGNFALSADLSYGAVGTLTLSTALDELNEGIGDRTYTEDNVVVDGETIASSVNSLDIAIGSIQSQTAVFSGVNVVATATVTVDTIPVALASEAKWIIQIRETATPANRRAVEVHAINDGTLIDHSESSILRLGSAINGFNVDVDVSGVDMRLRLTATNNLDYVVRRIAYTSF